MFPLNQQGIIFHLKLVIVILALVSYAAGYNIGDDPYRRGAILDDRGGSDRYKLEWMVNKHANRITFNVTVKTQGWILFGLANNAEGDTGRDVVIGGVWKNGHAYFSDKHTGRYNRKLEIDVSQDYTLLESWESGGHTFLSFSRSLETCDHEDYLITENRVAIVWAYGDYDSEDGDGGGGGGGHEGNRGSYDVYLLDPEFSPRVIPGKQGQLPRVTGKLAPTTKVWRITKQNRISQNDTSYMCTMHKAPRLPRKHHVIGFEVGFEDEISRVHIHHMVIHRCRAPRGESPRTLFESYARSGEEQTCLTVARPNFGSGSMPLHLCQQFYIMWGLGGREFFTPDHVGFPFGESPDEYYLVQVHYDNPNMRADITVNFHLDFFYTPQLRPNDGAIWLAGHEVPGLPLSFITPPQTPSIRRFGHCSSECTERILPEEGITLVATLLHSHISGRKLRAHHFRGGKELPWIVYDDNYSNNFQQIRALRQGEIKIYPGDQLTMDCVYDSTWTNSTVVGGYRTREEMCLFWGVYYNAIPEFSSCRSEIVAPPEYRQHFLAGVTNFTWLESRMDWVAGSPSPRHLVGRTLTDISDNFVEWDAETRRELAELQGRFTHTGRCNRHFSYRDPREVERLFETQRQISGDEQGLVFSGNNIPTNFDTEDDFSGPVDYPKVRIPYSLPETACPRRGHFPKRSNAKNIKISSFY